MIKISFKRNFLLSLVISLVFFTSLIFSPKTALSAVSIFDTYQCDCCPGCIPNGTGSTVQSSITSNLEAALKASANNVQTRLLDIYGSATNSILNKSTSVIPFLHSLEEVEGDWRTYWENLWQKSMLPSMMQMTEQLNATLVDQTRNYQSMFDASNQLAVEMGYDITALEDYRNNKSSDNTTIISTAVGGLGRASGFSKAMSNAWQKDSNAIGSNKKNTAGATGIAIAEKKRHDDYYNLFCNPDSAGGLNKCGSSDPKFYDADTQPSRYIYNKLTIPLNPADDPNGKMAKTIENILINLTGSPSAQLMAFSTIKTSTGKQNFLSRRSYLARHAAIRSIPQIIVGWRMPGSKIGQWVKELREDADVPLVDISSNPSYNEILHAISTDRFNSGKYAMKMISGKSEIEMEKLILNAFYLMRLRDYYELLERTALVLAVQVSIMADKITMPEALAVSNLSR